MDPVRREFTEKMLARVRSGRRDVLC